MKFEVCGFEHCHLHTSFSILDGYGHPEEYAERAPKINQQFLCVSDHGMMGAIPRQIRACKLNGISPIMACELYVQKPHDSIEGKNLSVELRKVLPNMPKSEREIYGKSYHLLAIARSNEGYSNLVKLCTWGHINGFYRNPRVTHEQLLRHKGGIIFTSCCYNGEIGQAFERGGEEAAFEVLEHYMSMFDDFYLELMLLDFKKQKPYDAFLIKAHDKYGLPLLLTQDVHYPESTDSKYQRLMLMVQTGRTLKDLTNTTGEQEFFELQDQNLWMKSEDEINRKWMEDYSDTIPIDLLNQAKRNSVEVCRRAKGVELDRSVKLPQIPDADEKFKQALFDGFKKRGLKKDAVYMKRLWREYELITRKDLASYFLIQKQIIDVAREVAPKMFNRNVNPIGPGRGSAVGSLACYCLGITDVDPLKHDLVFERFLSENRGRSMKIRFSEQVLERQTL